MVFHCRHPAKQVFVTTRNSSTIRRYVIHEVEKSVTDKVTKVSFNFMQKASSRNLRSDMNWLQKSQKCVGCHFYCPQRAINSNNVEDPPGVCQAFTS
jgi:Pyruvate/2-oxoacid:ferredoxin oxidoreductase delta subunit